MEAASSCSFLSGLEVRLAASRTPDDTTITYAPVCYMKIGYCEFFVMHAEHALISSLGMDVGVAELIHKGKVVIKQGVEVSTLTPSSVIFNDYSEHQADVIIYAWVMNFIECI